MTKHRGNLRLKEQNTVNMDNIKAFSNISIPAIELQVHSAPNSRNSSMKKRRRYTNEISYSDFLRRNSFPKPVKKLSRASSEIIVSRLNQQSSRIRSFKLSPDGILTDCKLNVNATNIRRKSSGSSVASSYRSRLYSTTSEESTNSCSSCSSGYYRISIIGASGVGKTSLQNRFMRSEYMSSQEVDDCDDNKLTVVVDNEESTIEFIDFSNEEENTRCTDAYVVTFSVHDHASYQIALGYLQYLRQELDSDRPIILVANKVDLVRKRQISKNEARQTAIEYECKYVETSAVLNHKVDELLVGLLKQIKLKLTPHTIDKVALRKNGSLEKPSVCKGPKKLLNKLFRRNTKATTLPCDNLFCL